MVTDHGQRSITAVEAAINPLTADEPRLQALPGVGRKTAWNLVSERAQRAHRSAGAGLESLEQVWGVLPQDLPEVSRGVLARSWAAGA